MSKQMKRYYIIGKLICKLATGIGIIGFYAMCMGIFIYAFIG